MSRDFRLYLFDIMEAAEKISEYKSGHSEESFALDYKTVDAVARNLEIIGEAVKNVPSEILNNEPDIDWKNTARLRDVIAHYYFKLDLDAIWEIITLELHQIEMAARRLYDSLPDPEA